MTNEAENDFVWETRAARDSIDGEGEESARGQQHFLLSVMGSVNRPNLGICTSADDERARKKQMRWGTKPRQASEAGDALEEGKPSSSFPLVVKLRCSIPQQEARLICEMGGGKDSSVSFDCIATAATSADRPKNCNYKRTGIGANRLICLLRMR